MSSASLDDLPTDARVMLDWVLESGLLTSTHVDIVVLHHARLLPDRPPGSRLAHKPTWTIWFGTSHDSLAEWHDDHWVVWWWGLSTSTMPPVPRGRSPRVTVERAGAAS